MVYGDGRFAMKKATLYLPEELKVDIETLSKVEKRSEAEIMRDALRDYVDQKLQIRSPRSIGMISDGSFDPENIDQYLQDNWKPDW